MSTSITSGSNCAMKLSLDLTGKDDAWQANHVSEQDPWAAAETYTWEQDMQRGDWPTQRTLKMPNPPWPSPNNPMLAALLQDTRKNIAEGMSIDVAILQLATHCWFEGGVEGYDRGQRDAREDAGSRPSSS